MMLAESGTYAVALAFAALAYATVGALLGIRRADERWLHSAGNALRASAALLGLALLLLLAALLGNDFSFAYVAQHSSRATPTYLKVSALWAGQEGSLLLWAFLQALLAAYVAGRPAAGRRELAPWATVVLSLVAAFFSAVLLFASSPFRALAQPAVDGAGLSPLLRHPGMIFHPPALYVGYVALAAPFAFAVAGLLTGNLRSWISAARGWLLIAWLFLGAGMLLGARWAYDVLGWGGYWAWDPVENAALMPWLAATALMHGSILQERRGSFRLSNWLLALASFALVLFGTFATRSGAIQSVHAFAPSGLGGYFIGAILLAVVGSTVLLAWRWRTAAGDPGAEFTPQEGAFLLTLVLLVTLTVSVFVGSVLPTVTEALGGTRAEAGPEWFDRVAGPQLAALLLVMGVCPLLGRTLATLRRSPARLLPAVSGAVALAAAAAATGFTIPASLAGLAAIGFAGGTAAYEVVRLLARPGRSGTLGLPANRRRLGAYLVHVAIVLIGLGVIGSRMYVQDLQLVLKPGVPAAVAGYHLVYEEPSETTAADHTSVGAMISLYRGGAYAATLQPRVDIYGEQTVSIPALLPQLREDFYLVLAGFSDAGDATVRVVVSPLINFVWLGGLLLLAGGALASWPAGQPRPAAAPRWRTARAGVALTGGLLALSAAAFAMWGTGHATIVRAAGRPMVGQPAPAFVLPALDGTELSSASLRGDIVVANFWATWCEYCKTELPALQTVWSEYEDSGVSFVGIAYRDEVDNLRAAVERYGLTYPVVIDGGESVAAAYGVTGIPETFVLDADGNVAYLHIGPVTAAQLRQELDALLKE
ncbi:MAG: cytochrome c-type biogenesis CcmF C-terminal domain-containing protein [Anaerolineae bacterium]